MLKKVALSIAGSDSSSGAGVQADLKSFAFLGIHGVTALTCITSQNTAQVKKIHKLPLELIESQIDVLFDDFEITAVKTGMLFDDEIIQMVSKKIEEYNFKPVVDPVMVATSGDVLSQRNLAESFKKHLFSKTLILTANIPEASILSGFEIKTINDVKKTCKKLHSFGLNSILIKGGHLDTNDAIDVLYDGKKFFNFSLPKIPNKKAHGSGCSLSALITGYLAHGESPVEAVRKAKYIVWSMINDGYQPGKGADVLNHNCKKILLFNISKNNVDIWVELKDAVEQLFLLLPIRFVPEVGMNFTYALENAKSFDDICAIDGRIIKTQKTVKVFGDINFGVSKHVASIVLAVMSFDKNKRSVLNIRYSKDNLIMCKKAGLSIGFFDREHEPKTTISTMEWGTKQAINNLGYVPDIIYDKGGIGKEPMIRILGNNPKDVLFKLKSILKIKKK